MCKIMQRATGGVHYPAQLRVHLVRDDHDVGLRPLIAVAQAWMPVRLRKSGPAKLTLSWTKYSRGFACSAESRRPPDK